MTQPRLVRCLYEGRPVMRDSSPRHCDCLRFDLGFCSPNDLSLVVFPVFCHRVWGSTGSDINLERWNADGLSLTPITVDWNDTELDIFSFVTFRQSNGLLIPTTLGQFLQDPDYNYRITDWRTPLCSTSKEIRSVFAMDV